MLYTGQALARAQIPHSRLADFRRAVMTAVADGQRVAALFGHVPTPNAKLDLYALLTDSRRATMQVAKTTLESDSFASMTPDCPQVHLFEREIAEEFGVHPEGHPWLKPVRFIGPYRRPADAAAGRHADGGPPIGRMEFFHVGGDEVHEVAVGPVHAGIIEPGHFRFQCHGEQVFHLEVSLGYQHRGIERALVGGPTKRTVHMIELIAGDASIGHATAYCDAVEGLAKCQVPIRSDALRGIALELERLANHTGDLGALAADVGFLPTAAFCGRIRGDFLNLTAQLCGSRFGRGMVRPGGVGFDLDEDRLRECLERLDAAYRDVSNAVALLWDSASVQARFDGTGIVRPEICSGLGLVGPAARACGIECDVRQDFPSGIFRFAQIPVSTWQTGDVFARAYVRWLEIQRSVSFVQSQLRELPGGPILANPFALLPDHFVATLVEGWRGQICHVALTDADGRFARYKIVDPSFHNWAGLALALRDQQISDFPLCNKSFNLSYCGHDV
jgi:Ni,Fe-hydrogenase III large subunit